MPKGLTLSIFKNDGRDFSNGGLSSKANEVTLVGPGVPELFEATEKAPAVVLKEGPLGTIRVVPLDLAQTNTWVMFGGTFVFTSDSRFGAAIRAQFGKDRDTSIALKLFDRVEG